MDWKAGDRERPGEQKHLDAIPYSWTHLSVPLLNSLQPQRDLYFPRRWDVYGQTWHPSVLVWCRAAKGQKVQTEHEDDTLGETCIYLFFLRKCFGRIMWGFDAVTLPTFTASLQMHKFPWGCLHSEGVTDVFFFLPQVFVCVGEAKVQYYCKSDERARVQCAVNPRIFFYHRSETPKHTGGEEQAIELAGSDPALTSAN